MIKLSWGVNVGAGSILCSLSLAHDCFVNKIKITERRILTGDFGWFTNRNKKREPMRYLLEICGAAQKSLKIGIQTIAETLCQIIETSSPKGSSNTLIESTFLFKILSFSFVISPVQFFIATVVNFLELFVTYSLNTCFNDSKVISKVNIPCITNDNLF